MSYLPIYRKPPLAWVGIGSSEFCITYIPFVNNFGSAAWPTANLAYFIPFILSFPVQITALWAENGSTASGNLDMGIYSVDGTKLVSTGSTAQSGTTAIQLINIVPTTIGPGNFYFAIAENGTSGTFLAESYATVAGFASMNGIYQMASAFPLPQNAIFATSSANFYLPAIGFQTTPTGSAINLSIYVRDFTQTSENITEYITTYKLATTESTTTIEWLSVVLPVAGTYNIAVYDVTTTHDSTTSSEVPTGVTVFLATYDISVSDTEGPAVEFIYVTPPH